MVLFNSGALKQVPQLVSGEFSDSTQRSCLLQVVLINAVKDVAKALGNLISATKAAAGKPHDDPSMLQLKSSAKVEIQLQDLRLYMFVL